MTLRPFFCFYGGKWRTAHKLYPTPEHDTIVEPFAGGAGYSIRHAGRKVILCDVDPVIAGVWSYLIKTSKEEILALPDIGHDQTVDDMPGPQEAKWLVGFWLNKGSAAPSKRPSKWMRSNIRPNSYWGPAVRQILASQVDHIRHWQVSNCNYYDAPVAGSATWFVDPPYEVAGAHYRFGSKRLDFMALGEWCKTRPGQTIVCENEGATWLPFVQLAKTKASIPGTRSSEVVWMSKGGE